MAVMFFGQYLVEKGIVSREALLQAIELQESVNLSVGAVSVSMGLLTEADVERINQCQRTEDLRFGDMAAKLGLLSQEQFQQVLTKQKNNHLYIGEALVRVGGLTSENLPHYLEEFKQNQSLYATDRVVIPDGVSNAQIWEVFADLTYKMLTRVARLTFHSEPAHIAAALPPFSTIAAMGFKGDVNGTYLFAVQDGARKRIASAILNQEDVDMEEDEVLDDTVMEFVNVVCGNIAAKVAQLGSSFEIEPPELLDGSSGLAVASGRTGVVFPICLSDGELASMAIFIE